MLMLGDRRPWGRDRWDYLGYTEAKRGTDIRVAYHNPEVRMASWMRKPIRVPYPCTMLH